MEEESTKKSKEQRRCSRNTTYSAHLPEEVQNLKASSTLFKFCRISLIILATIAFGIHVCFMTIIFFKYEYYEKVENDQESELVFPDVTICDNKGYSEMDALKGNKEKLLKSLRNWQQAQQTVEKIEHHDLGDLAANILQSTEGYTANFAMDLDEVMSLTLYDFVINCKYFERECKFENFHLYEHPVYYNCYTFKSMSVNSTQTPIHNNNNIGPNNGLSLILHSLDESLNHFYDIFSNTENSKGARLAIHEPGTDPDIFDSGIDILPGISTSVALVQREYHRLKQPHSDCVDAGQYVQGNNTFKLNPPLCKKLCLAQHILEACHCVSLGVNLWLPDWVNDTVRPCFQMNTSNPDVSVQRALCKIAVVENITFNSKNMGLQNKCKCSWNCFELEYDITTSQAKWPQKILIRHFKELFLNNSKSEIVKNILEKLETHYHKNSKSGVKLDTQYDKNSKPGVNQELTASSLLRMVFGGAIDLRNETIYEAVKQLNIDYEVEPSLLEQSHFDKAISYWVQQSFSRVNVFFKKGTVERHKQIVAFGMVDFWSSVGGIAGLWIGASLLSIIDIVQFFALTLSHVHSKIKTTGNRVEPVTK